MPKDYAGNNAAWVATVPVPNKDDINALSEALMAPAWQANGDRSAYLQRVWPMSYYYTGSGSPLWSTNSSTGATSDAVGAFVDVPDVKIGDKVRVTANLSIRYTGNNPSAANGNTLEIVVLGNGGLIGGSTYYIPGARANTTWSGMLGTEFTFELGGVWTATAAAIARMCLKFTALNLETLNVDALTLVATRYAAL